MLAIILAAGDSSRIGTPFPKTFLPLPGGETILERLVRQLRLQCDEVRLVRGPWDEEFVKRAFRQVNAPWVNPDPIATNLGPTLQIGLGGYQGQFVAIASDLVLRELPRFDVGTYYTTGTNHIVCSFTPVPMLKTLRIFAKRLKLSHGGELEGVNCNAPEDYFRAIQMMYEWLGG